jgi:hypothetical protein
LTNCRVVRKAIGSGASNVVCLVVTNTR